MRHCPVCQSRFPNFLPLPNAYFESAARLSVPYSMEDFETLNVGQYSCPACFSSDRDRLYALYVDHMLQRAPGMRVLEIAPAQGLSRFLRALPGVSYRSADLFSPLAMDKVDIMDMALYADGMFDLVVCSHVLEHVPDDLAALRELWRVLAPGGHAILMVPILTTATQTEEDPHEQDPEERERRFGQDDHVRMYARHDFVARIRAAGFELTELGESDFAKASGQAQVFRERGITSQSVLYVGSKPAIASAPKDTSQAISQPEVTVAIPAYKPDYLGAAIDSALAQTHPNFEVLVCDDSPGTDVEQLVRSRQRDGVRLRYLRNTTNLGEAGNVRRCVDEAQGQYIKLLFDDDVLAPECLSRMAAVLRAQPGVSLVGSRRLVIDEKGETLDHLHSLAYFFPFSTDVRLEGEALVSFLGDNTINFIGEPSTVMFRAEDVRRAAPGDLYALGGETIRWIGDLSLYVKLLRFGDLALLQEPLSSFRISAEQTSRQARDAANVGKDAHALFCAKLRELGWYHGPNPIKVCRLSGPVAFVPFDLGAVWREFLQGGQTAAPVAGPEPAPAQVAATLAASTTAKDLEYDRWARQRPMGQRPTQWTTQRRLGVLVFVDQTQPAALDATQHSLAAQWRLADEITQVDLAGAHASLPVQADTGWTLLLAAGDHLAADALYQIEKRLLHEDAAAALVLYTDHDEIGPDGHLCKPAFKPAFNADLLLSSPYPGRAVVVRNDWLVERSGPRVRAPWSLAYALCLEAGRTQGSAGVIHLAAALLHLSADVVPTCIETTPDWQALAEVLTAHAAAAEPGSQVLEGPAPGTFHVVPPLGATPMVSIVIPTKNQLPLLSRCIETVLAKTDYPAFEVLIVDNGSDEADALAFLAGIEGMNSEQLRVVRAPGPFNFSKMNNQAVAAARGELVLMLNNDTAALQADWLQHMVRHALRPGVGIVGARLLFPDGLLQHAGVVMGLRGPADHVAIGLKTHEPGYMFRAQLTQNFSAVTAACLLVRRDLYLSVGGLDEADFGVSFNDVDFCLRVVTAGHRIVWTPLAVMLHEGSASQRAAVDGLTFEQKISRYATEKASLYQRWPQVIANDPAYNPNLSLIERGYEVETNPLLRPDPERGKTPHHVVAFAADPFGCGHYRVLQPMAAMLAQGLCTGGASPELFGPNLALRSGADTLVFQRPVSDANQELLEALLCLRGVKKVFEIDDELSALPFKSAHRAHMPSDMRARMLRNIALCDRLVVSTEPLADRLRQANGDVRVVANRLPPAMWGERAPVRGERDPARRKPVVGWAGGVGHQGDLALISQLVRDTADQIDWVFFGMCPDDIRDHVHSYHPGVPTLEYPKQLMRLSQQWDLALAPLEINTFNECKSNLRLLEYGWCGVPVICTDIVPYQGDLPVTRVKNRYKDWRNAVLQAVADPLALRREGLLLQQSVAQDWVLKGAHLDQWYQAWAED